MTNTTELREALAKATEPWKDFHGDLPDYDHPLRCVYESGIQYAVELLAKELGVEEYDVCDGTEEFDGDLGGTLFNIVLAAMPKDKHGDALHPSELPALLDELDRLTQAERSEVERLREALKDAAHMLDWAARMMKGHLPGSTVNAVMLAAGRATDARAALNPKREQDNADPL